MSLRATIMVAALMLSTPQSRADGGKEQQADILMLALPATAYALTLNNDDGPGTWMLTKSLALSTITTIALNSVIDKDSPNGSSSDAFPSGHSTVAFGSAAFIQRRYGWRLGVPAYAAASYVAWLRVETDDHDVADVLGGAAVGIISSYLLTTRFDDTVQASAWVDGRYAGLQVQIRW